MERKQIETIVEAFIALREKELKAGVFSGDRKEEINNTEARLIDLIMK